MSRAIITIAILVSVAGSAWLSLRSSAAEDSPAPPDPLVAQVPSVPSITSAAAPSAEQRACSDNADIAAKAIQELRAMGPAGLQRMFAAYPMEIAFLRGRKSSDQPISPEIARVRRALDAVAQQKDAYSSGLFWHTDLDEARRAAAREQKPILALRMLGKLTDECSCANSRFFRTALYANRDVSAYLRDNFVLVWTSERPVPLITIDFGDGRKIERTITGNSAHYILNADGIVVEALPGLYGPGAFLKQLREACAVSRETAGLERGQADAKLAEYHNRRIAELQQEWAMNLSAIEVKRSVSSVKDGRPKAEDAAVRAEGKSVVETPLIRAVRGLNALEKSTDDAAWAELAPRYAGDSKLDAGSIELMRSKYPAAAQAAPVAVTKIKVESPLLRAVGIFQTSLALDTVKNEYLLHRQIHQWLAQGVLNHNLSDLNKKVYAELFLTPAEDPWLGLAPADTYTGLENEGLVR